MRILLDLKDGNLDSNNIAKEIEITPKEYEHLTDIIRRINTLSSQNFINAYIKEI